MMTVVRALLIWYGAKGRGVDPSLHPTRMSSPCCPCCCPGTSPPPCANTPFVGALISVLARRVLRVLRHQGEGAWHRRVDRVVGHTWGRGGFKFAIKIPLNEICGKKAEPGDKYELSTQIIRDCVDHIFLRPPPLSFLHRRVGGAEWGAGTVATDPVLGPIHTMAHPETPNKKSTVDREGLWVLGSKVSYLFSSYFFFSYGSLIESSSS